MKNTASTWDDGAGVLMKPVSPFAWDDAMNVWDNVGEGEMQSTLEILELNDAVGRVELSFFETCLWDDSAVADEIVTPKGFEVAGDIL